MSLETLNSMTYHRSWTKTNHSFWSCGVSAPFRGLIIAGFPFMHTSPCYWVRGFSGWSADAGRDATRCRRNTRRSLSGHRVDFPVIVFVFRHFLYRSSHQTPPPPSCTVVRVAVQWPYLLSWPFFYYFLTFAKYTNKRTIHVFGGFWANKSILTKKEHCVNMSVCTSKAKYDIFLRLLTTKLALHTCVVSSPTSKVQISPNVCLPTAPVQIWFYALYHWQ